MSRPQDLCRKLRDSGVPVTNFTCEAVDKTFILKGQTTSFYYKQMAQEAVKKILPANFRVVNEIVVT